VLKLAAEARPLLAHWEPDALAAELVHLSDFPDDVVSPAALLLSRIDAVDPEPPPPCSTVPWFVQPVPVEDEPEPSSPPALGAALLGMFGGAPTDVVDTDVVDVGPVVEAPPPDVDAQPRLSHTENAARALALRLALSPCEECDGTGRRDVEATGAVVRCGCRARS